MNNQRRQQQQQRSQNFQLPSITDHEWKLAKERKQTLTEWTSQLSRMSAATAAESPKNSQLRWGGPNNNSAGHYNGLYKYMSSLDHRHSNQAQQQQKQQEWKWKTDPNVGHDSELIRQETHRQRKIGAWKIEAKKANESPLHEPIFISDIECQDIQRCFIAADLTEDGYLNCEEFKNFMEYRRCPITHLEARKLLHETDPVYRSFIDLDQIMFLVLNCGLTTQGERGLTSDEFRSLIGRLHSEAVREANEGHNLNQKSSIKSNPSSSRRGPSSTVIQENLDLNGAISYFHDLAYNVREKEYEEERYHEYRRGLRENSATNPHNENNNDDDHLLPNGNKNNYYPPPPGWKNMLLHSQDPSCHEPIDFKKLKGEWQTKAVEAEEKKKAERFFQLNQNNFDGDNCTNNDDSDTSTNSIDKIIFPNPPALSICQTEANVQQQLKVPASPNSARVSATDQPKSQKIPETPLRHTKSFATELREVLSIYRTRIDRLMDEEKGAANQPAVESASIIFKTKTTESKSNLSQHDM